LHGDGPTLDIIEGEKLHYIAGANKLDATQTILESQPQCVWESLGAKPEVCVCRIEQEASSGGDAMDARGRVSVELCGSNYRPYPR